MTLFDDVDVWSRVAMDETDLHKRQESFLCASTTGNPCSIGKKKIKTEKQTSWHCKL